MAVGAGQENRQPHGPAPGRQPSRVSRLPRYGGCDAHAEFLWAPMGNVGRLSNFVSRLNGRVAPPFFVPNWVAGKNSCWRSSKLSLKLQHLPERAMLAVSTRLSIKLAAALLLRLLSTRAPIGILSRRHHLPLRRTLAENWFFRLDRCLSAFLVVALRSLSASGGLVALLIPFKLAAWRTLAAISPSPRSALTNSRRCSVPARAHPFVETSPLLTFAPRRPS